MKPNFALKLSNDGAQLLHRSGALWVPVGSVSFETDDVATACAALVASAKALAPEGLRTKVVIPASEIRYDLVSAPGPTDEARRYQIEAEIERLTPYRIDELAYDFAVEDDSVLVAICARETLTEAETFAEGYGFHPVSCVAIPDPGDFSGEPWFGETTVARAYLPAGVQVTRDAEPVRIAAATVRSPAAQPAIAPAPPSVSSSVSPSVSPAAAPPVVQAPPPAAPPKPVVPAAIATVRSAPGPASAPVAPPAPRPSPVLAATPVAPPRALETPPAAAKRSQAPSQSLSERTDAGLSKVGDLVRRVGNRLRREQAAQISAARHAPPQAQPSAQAAGSPPPALPPAPVSPLQSAPQSTPPTAQTTEAPAPVAFASRRRPEPVVVAASGQGAGPAKPGPGGRLAVLPNGAKASAAPAELLRRSAAGMQSALSRVRGLRLPRRPAAPAPVVATSRPPRSEQDRNREKEALTLFGARGNPVPETNLARRGLVAAGGLLALFMAVAIWSLYFSGDEPPQLADTGSDVAALPGIQPPAEVPTVTADAQPASPPLAAPAPVAQVAEAPAAPDPEDLAEDLANAARDETLVVPAEVAADDPPSPVDPATEAPAVVAQPLSEPPPTAAAAAANQPSEPRIAETGGAETAAVALSEVPEQRLSLPGPITVPPVDEVAFAPPPPPPPFGSTFVFDSSGLVVATPEGALTPSGVTVFAARPPVAPAPAPGRPAVAAAEVPAVAAPAAPAAESVPESAAVAPAAEAPPPAGIASAVESALSEAVAETAPLPAPAPEASGGAPVAGTEVVYDDTPRADPALAGARPLAPPARVRALRDQAAPAAAPAPAPAAPEPDDQTLLDDPADAAAVTDTAALDVPSPGGVSLAALRPLRRPTDLVPVAEPVAAATPDPLSPDLAGATAEAVAASPIPGSRPSSVQERARQILAAASAPRAASTAAPEPEDEADEPATTAAAPSIPSTASVARQATETNAINLSAVNLIGVFGTPNDRRALVRLSSGRVVRVSVGDRLDGGQVTAIGEGELRYTAGGSNQILRIGG